MTPGTREEGADGTGGTGEPPPDWDPAQYEKFRRERAEPFLDLLALVERRPGMRVLDVGCGTGELTRLLHETLVAKETLGVDPSEAMLEKAAPRAGGGLRFARGRAEDLDPGTGWDLVLSNAVLHWVPDHRSILTRFASWLSPRGEMAVQVPANQDDATTRLAAEVASEEPFRTRLAGWSLPDHRLSPEGYARLLFDLGFAVRHVRVQVYGHVLASREDAVEWVKGALLVEYRARLGEASFGPFLERYRERLLAVLPDERPFFFPFRRILLSARRE